MKGKKYKNQLLILMLVVGFFVGILYENMVSKKFGTSVEIFQNYFLNQYKQMDIVSEEYLWYVVKARGIMLIGILAATRLKWKKTIICAMTAWTGFVLGIIMVASIIQLGLKGIIFCVMGMFPHLPFYILTYSVLFIYFFHYPRQMWKPAKSIFVVLCMCLGIIFETYLNPPLMKWLVGMI